MVKKHEKKILMHQEIFTPLKVRGLEFSVLKRSDLIEGREILRVTNLYKVHVLSPHILYSQKDRRTS